MKRVLEPEVMDTDEEADSYDAMDHSGPNQSFIERLVDLGLRGRCLDIGCGPGQVALMACGEVQDLHVTGVDLADTMLAHAQRHLQESDVAGRVVFQKADAKNLPFEDESFDTVWSNTILHHIPDPLPFLKDAHRVLRPGGVLLIRDLFRPESRERVAELVQLYAQNETPYSQELFRASLCAAFTVRELQELKEAAGLTEMKVAVDTDRHMSLQGVKSAESNA